MAPSRHPTRRRPHRPAPTHEPPAVPWAQLRNPLLTSSQYAVKDPALVYAGGAWHALFSAVDRAGTWRIGLASSPDLRHWSAITTMPHDPTIAGEVSPDVVRAPDGRWVVTYQSSVHDGDTKAAKLYYRTTDDFARVLTGATAGPGTAPGRRRSDDRRGGRVDAGGAAARLQVGADEQHFELARSESGSLDGPWKLIGRPDITRVRRHDRELPIPAARRTLATAGDQQHARPSVPLHARPATRTRPRAGCTGRRAASSTSRRSRGTAEPARPAAPTSTRTAPSSSTARRSTAPPTSSTPTRPTRRPSAGKARPFSRSHEVAT